MSKVTKKLNEYINFKDGFFIEAGSYDGIFLSNTLALEKELNWNGLLIEPNFEKYLECLNNRKDSTTVLAALCSFKEYKDNKILYISDNGPISSINNLRHKRRKFIIRKKNKLGLIPTYAIPFSHLMKNLGFDKQAIDFFSLDVEGYEFRVLNGIDFDKHKPKYFLVEVYSYDKERIFKFFKKNNYKEPINLSNFNKKNNTNWDGLHQDYLFVSK
tara:strand:- start:773 stop:1417 length:645 start_codon:yes stop_codon:yes gene_type:complete